MNDALQLAILLLAAIAIGVYVVRCDEQTHWERSIEYARESGSLLMLKFKVVTNAKGEFSGEVFNHGIRIARYPAPPEMVNDP